ncbi:MAG: hypothetical protein RMK18_09580 [Armatimonadota bacterium]|nr:hypothetical protein [Armatimonadota bacterium]MCX7776572.1 hypothetical protein [Armatimonadota bacterium]MDW8026094.1 hypothetical protein [Armatimonadota bacterium]
MFNRRLSFLLLVLACALLVRLIGISERDLYCDEAVVMLYSKMSWERLLQILPHENYGPLWFVTQKLWNYVDGYVWARLLSVALGVALVATSFDMGMRIGGLQLAFIAGLITATNCYLVSFSQKVWSYMPCTTFVMFALLAAVRLLQSRAISKPYMSGSELNSSARDFNEASWLILTYCIAALLALYTHYIALPVLIVIAIVCAVHLRHAKGLLARWCIAHLIIASMMLPWAKFTLQRVSSVAHGFHMSKASLLGILDMLHDFTTFAPSVHHAAIHARIVVILAAILFSYLLVRGFWTSVMEKKLEPLSVIFLLGVTLWIMIALFLPVWHPRTLLPLAPLYCLIISKALASHRRKITIVLSSSVLALNLASLWFYFADEAYAEAQWKEAAGYLMKHRKSEPVVHSSVLSFAPITYHMGSTSGHMVLGLTEETATAATNFVLLIEPKARLEDFEELRKAADEFWLVETTDWRPWIKWRSDRAVVELRSRAAVELALYLRGVSVYRCKLNGRKTGSKTDASRGDWM